MNMKDSMQELKKYMMQKFVLILIFLVVMERFTNLIFTRLIFPYLNLFFEKNHIQIKYSEDGMFFGVIIYLFILVIECMIEILPKIISIPLSLAFQNSMLSMFQMDTDIFAFSDKIPQEIAFFLRIAVLALILLLLFIAVLPYMISIMIYGIVVSQKAMEQERIMEQQRNLLLADIAHDLKTPLTTVTGYAQALRDDVEEDEEKKKQYLENIYRKSKKMDEMLTFLFEYLKLESGGFTLKKEHTDVGEILRENVALLYMDFEEKGIALQVEIPEKPCFYNVDKVQISRAIGNLLNNMLKHNQQGRTVFVFLKQKEDLEIHIADNGIQITEEMAKHIFEPFAMGDESRTSKNGSGLGLSIAFKIAQMHGGRLELNRNSTETFTKEFIIIL